MKRPPMRWREPRRWRNRRKLSVITVSGLPNTNTPQLASPSPELLIARILGRQRVSAWDLAVSCCNTTARIKLQKISISAAPAPGRVDLGVGKAPGGLPLSTRALQLGLNQQEKGSFAEQLAQLDSWIRPENQSAEEAVRATPLPPVPAQGFCWERVSKVLCWPQSSTGILSLPLT